MAFRGFATSLIVSMLLQFLCAEPMEIQVSAILRISSSSLRKAAGHIESASRAAVHMWRRRYSPDCTRLPPLKLSLSTGPLHIKVCVQFKEPGLHVRNYHDNLSAKFGIA